MQETQVQSLVRKIPWRNKYFISHSSILGWKIPWTKVQSMELQIVGHDLATKQQWDILHSFLHIKSKKFIVYFTVTLPLSLDWAHFKWSVATEVAVAIGQCMFRVKRWVLYLSVQLIIYPQDGGFSFFLAPTHMKKMPHSQRCNGAVAFYRSVS